MKTQKEYVENKLLKFQYTIILLFHETTDTYQTFNITKFEIK